MGKGDRLGEFEEQVLLGLAAAGDGAHARGIYRRLVSATGRTVSITSVHVTLARLEAKGYVESWMSYPDDVDDARARKAYALTAFAARSLRENRAAYEELWAAAAGHPRLGSR